MFEYAVLSAPGIPYLPLISFNKMMNILETNNMGSAFMPSNPWVETPLIESSALSRAAGCRIFLKLENLQPSGSFKSRGIGALLQHALVNHDNPNVVHFYCSSGGNAGLACVTAAQTLNRPATVVVPLTTKPFMIAKLRNAGAYEVVQVGNNWKEADTYLRERLLQNDAGGVYVPPFDHPAIWEGHSTMVSEVARQLQDQGEEGGADAMACSVGGGGLLCGVLLGLERQHCDWSKDCKVLALETEGAESLNKSLLEGQLVTLPSITTIATSLGATRVAQTAFDLAQKHEVKSVVLSDAEAAMGCWRFADDERIMVEPACGVSLAVCYDGRLKKLLPELTPKSKVIIVVCGGSNITLQTLMAYRNEYGWIEKSTTDDAEIPSTLSAPNGVTHTK
ncbi:MAG: hypothetical protein Q9168_006632 [Polycauliona sp. 1 TL-2023]